MPDLNQCSFTGRLGRDPETRSVGDTSVTNFSIAVDDSYKKQSGEKVDSTVWLDVDVWGGLGEKVAAVYCSKGSRVAVSGQLKLETWDDKQTGAKRSKHKLRAMSLVLLGDGQQQGGGQSMQNDAPRTQPQGSYTPHSQAGGGGAVDENDIPFAPDPIGGFDW
jgi:single-strand DNA-binding protein